MTSQTSPTQSLQIESSESVARLLAEAKKRRIKGSSIEWSKELGFDPAPHHELILREMEALMASVSYDTLLLFAPPGSAKSHHVSVAFPPWYLANHPRHSVIAASHSTELAAKWGRRVRNLIASYLPKASSRGGS